MGEDQSIFYLFRAPRCLSVPRCFLNAEIRMALNLHDSQHKKNRLSLSHYCQTFEKMILFLRRRIATLSRLRTRNFSENLNRLEMVHVAPMIHF